MVIPVLADRLLFRETLDRIDSLKDYDNVKGLFSDMKRLIKGPIILLFSVNSIRHRPQNFINRRGTICDSRDTLKSPKVPSTMSSSPRAVQRTLLVD